MASLNRARTTTTLSLPIERMLQRRCNRTFYKPSVAVVDARAVAKVFRSSSSRQLQPPLLGTIGMVHIKQFFGNQSVGVTEGTQWKTSRKAIGKSLKPSYVRSLFSQIDSCAASVVEILEQHHTAGTEIDVAPLFHAAALDIVCESVFCERLGAIAALAAGRPDPVVDAFRLASSCNVTAAHGPRVWMGGWVWVWAWMCEWVGVGVCVRGVCTQCVCDYCTSNCPISKIRQTSSSSAPPAAAANVVYAAHLPVPTCSPAGLQHTQHSTTLRPDMA